MSDNSFGRFIEITFAGTPPPVSFAPLFAAKYPEDRRFLAQAVSKRINAVGAGTITLVDATGKQTLITVADGDRRDVEAVGVHAVTGPTALTVML